MAAHLNKWFQPNELVQPNELHFSIGCTSLCEMLGFTLFEEGDGLLLSRPVYQAFKDDFGVRPK
jgi:1-aminocyclopropane-1-carboxylate synthase